MIKLEIRYFFTALMFFTRIPCPPWVDHSEEFLNKSRKYFPMMGWIVGGISAVILYLSFLILPLPVAVILSIIASVYTTGAFHEDGFADVCDGFGGGWTKEQILTIMKDSRVGAYGVIGMLLLILLKAVALFEIGQKDIFLLLFSIINAHTFSRFVASTFVHSHDYVTDIDVSKARPIANQKLKISEMIFSGITAIIPAFLFGNWWFLFAFPVAFAPKFYLGYYFKKHIGGYTGDCLGATQQITEVIYYLAIIVLCKYM